MHTTNARTVYFSSADLPGGVDGLGFVYVIGRSLAGPVKVGSTINPKARIKALELGAGVLFPIIWLSAPIVNYKAAEATAHRAMQAFRGVGEWYNEDVTFEIAIALAVQCCSMRKLSRRVLLKAPL